MKFFLYINNIRAGHAYVVYKFMRSVKQEHYNREIANVIGCA